MEDQKVPAWYVFVIAVAIIASVLVLCSEIATAGGPLRPIPAEQWTPQARYMVARCAVGEAGLSREREHVAIAQVIARRWARRVKQDGEWTIKHQVSAYCAGYSPSSAANQWVKDLPRGQQDQWPREAGSHEAEWWKLHDRLDAWSEGRVHSPCRGADHWGGLRIAIDRRRANKAVSEGRWRKIKCQVETANTFYALTGGG